MGFKGLFNDHRADNFYKLYLFKRHVSFGCIMPLFNNDIYAQYFPIYYTEAYLTFISQKSSHGMSYVVAALFAFDFMVTVIALSA